LQRTRDDDREPRALPYGRSQFDWIIKEAAEPINNRKAKPYSAALIPFRFANPLELVENLLSVILRNPGAGVPHLDV
jgi:hypothetical protein